MLERHPVRRAGGIAATLFAAALSCGASRPAHATDNPTSAVREEQLVGRMAYARDRVLPYVVSILVVREGYANGVARRDVSGGSGTIFSADGHVLTNAHVIDNGRAFRVILADRSELPATLVGEDSLSDLAVLKIDVPGRRFEHARFATGAETSAGDTVLAMGSPWGYSQSLSVGVVNNPRRLLVSLFQDEADYEATLGPDQPTARYYAWIQHDAPIAPGNSGGPLVSLDGTIIGVNTRANMLGGDLAFAIPARDAAQIANALVAHGHVPRAWLGFKLRSLAGTGLSEGALINGVVRGTPAFEAGLRAGDRILALEGEKVALARPEDVPALERALAERRVGDAVKLSVERGGKRRDVALVARAYPVDRGDERELARWGVTLAELTPGMAQRRALDDDDGLLVTGVRPGGPASAAKPALQPGDVIRAYGARGLAELDDLPALGGEIGKPATLALDRNGETLLAVLTPVEPDTLRTPQPELPKPWAGAEVQAITPSLASLLGLGAAAARGGYRVTRIYPGGPFARAGIAVGDLVIALEGKEVKPFGDGDVVSFQRRVRDAEPGRPFAVRTVRDGKVRDVAVALIDGPATPSAMAVADIARFGLAVRELSFFDRTARRLAPDVQGVIVQSVESGGLAGLAHLADDDLILRIGERDIDGLASVREALNADDVTPSFLVLRGTETRLLFLDRAWIEELSK